MKKILITSIAILSLFSLVGCSQNSTKSTSSSTKDSQNKDSDQPSKEFKEKIKEQQKTMNNGIDDTPYSSVELTAYDKNTLLVTYTFSDKVYKDELVDENTPQMIDAIGFRISRGFKDTVKDLKVKLIYLNPDKSVIYSKVVTQKDLDKFTKGTSSED